MADGHQWNLLQISHGIRIAVEIHKLSVRGANRELCYQYKVFGALQKSNEQRRIRARSHTEVIAQ